MIFLIFSTILTCLLGLTGGLLFLINTKTARKIQKFGPIVATIIILWTVFGDLIPEIFENENMPSTVYILLIISGFSICAIFGFFLGHFHHHTDICANDLKGKHNHNLKSKNNAITILIVDTIHNAADGIVIGVGFLAGTTSGLMTCLSTLFHEIPQEVGDFAIMQKSGLPKHKIIKFQAISSLITVPVAAIIYGISTDIESLENILSVLLSFVAGFLIYIALSELVEVIHEFKK